MRAGSCYDFCGARNFTMSLLLPVGTLWWRELVRFYRQRGRLLGALGMPLIFWIFIGSGIGASFQPPVSDGGVNYLEYFYPGTMIMIVLFTSIFSSISVIEDRREGFLLSVLVAPVSRSGVVLGKVLGGATLAFVQGFLFVAAAPLVGIPLNPYKILVLAGILFVTAFSLAALGFVFAWRSDSTQGFHAVMNVLLFPMWVLSGAIFPSSGAAAWVGWIMKVNPLTYELAAIRHVLYEPGRAGLGDLPSFSFSLLMTGLFTLGVFSISFLVVRRRTVRSLG